MVFKWFFKWSVFGPLIVASRTSTYQEESAEFKGSVINTQDEAAAGHAPPPAKRGSWKLASDQPDLIQINAEDYSTILGLVLL